MYFKLENVKNQVQIDRGSAFTVAQWKGTKDPKSKTYDYTKVILIKISCVANLIVREVDDVKEYEI